MSNFSKKGKENVNQWLIDLLENIHLLFFRYEYNSDKPTGYMETYILI